MTHHRNSRPMPRFRRLLRWALIAFAAAVLLGGLALATLYFVVSAKLPDVQTLRHVEMQEPMYVYARDGRLLALRSEEHTSELQSLMRISYAVFGLKHKNTPLSS